MLGDRKGTHFTTQDLKSIGFYFCDTLLDYCDPDPTKVTEKQFAWLQVVSWCGLFNPKKNNEVPKFDYVSSKSVCILLFQVTYCLTELAALLRKQVSERLGKDLGTDCNITVSDLETRW